MEKNCLIHPHRKGEMSCGICEEKFCSQCLTEENGTVLCSGHKEIFLKSTWIKSIAVTCSEESSELGLGLYQFKESLWTSKNIPTYLSFKYSFSSPKKSFLTTMELHSLSKDLAIVKSLWEEEINYL